MSVIELRAAIHHKIDAVTDEFELEELNRTLDSILSDNLSEKEIFVVKRLNQAIRASNKGKLVSHEEVMKQQRAWLESKRPVQ